MFEFKRHPGRSTAAGRVAVGLVIGSLVVALSGCGEEAVETPEVTQSAVELAQAEVSAAEQALADAESAAADARSAFCPASATYITALDRYGDVLTQTAPTVGDINDAGEDLIEPRDEVVAAGEAVVSTREAVSQAQQDLADAQAALAAAEAEAAGSPAPTAPEATPDEAPAPPASLDRVKQAEADFAAAQEGITPETPLQEASVQFNSAAVALQMAWLQLFAEVGCLSDEQQAQAATAVRDYTLALQQALADAGYYTAAVDGVYGPATVDAVIALQEANGLPQTGWVDKATDAALRAELEALGVAAAQQAAVSTAAIQQTLKLAGYWDGPVDGQWSDELTEAIKALQTDLGVPATGTVDAATIAAFETALAAAQESASPSPSESEAATAEPSETSGDE